MKVCKECGKEKSKADFYGVQGECKECTKKRVKLYSRSLEKECLVCGSTFGTCITEVKKGGGKFCSRKCWYKWFKEENVYNYKGEDSGYSAKHYWIQKKLGKPNYCEHCKRTDQKRYHWSNISGKYLRDISDWQRLCVKCHSKYDLENRKSFLVKCVVCGVDIKTKSKKRMFCSGKCSNKYYRLKNGIKPFKIKCKVCGKEVETMVKRRLYCSKKCSSKYYRSLINKTTLCQI